MNIAKSLEKYLILSNKYESKGHKGKKFYLSDSGKCERVRFLKRKGVKTEFAPYVTWILQMGNLIHDYGYKALEAQGILLKSEDTIETEHFKGRYDGQVEHKKKNSVFDFKSASKWKFKKVMDGISDDDSYKQLLNYVMLLQEAGEDISDTAFLVYFNKEPGDQYGCVQIPFFQKEYHLTNLRRKSLKEEMDRLVGYWVENKIPKCSCPAWMKPYNSFLPLCQATDKELKKILGYLEDEKTVITTKKGLFLEDGDTRVRIIL